jgi:hypothetical protein
MLDARGQTYVDGDLRAAIKGAVSCLAGEAAAQAEAQHAENMRQVEQGFGLAGGLLALLNKHFGDE